MDRNVFEDYTNASNTTLKDILIRYRDEVTPTKKGYKSEEYRINKLLRHKICLVNLMRLKSSHIAGLRNDLKDKAPQTIKHYIQIISVAWNTAKREWGITLPAESPVALVVLPKVNNEREYILTYKQYSELLDACSPYIKDFVIMLYETGARYGEVASLKHENVSLEQRRIKFVDTKNGDDRTIPINDTVYEILKRYRFGATVFNIDYQKFYDHFCRAKKIAGLNYFHAHDLRACFCTNALLSGLSIPEVASLSGHKDWKMLKRYTRIKPVDLEEKIKKIIWIEKFREAK
jgi:integrase|tara:strand:- start:96 stop:965 length:870 start_codon:yes stop_codon:yes gene_type:complete